MQKILLRRLKILEEAIGKIYIVIAAAPKFAYTRTRSALSQLEKFIDVINEILGEIRPFIEISLTILSVI